MYYQRLGLDDFGVFQGARLDNLDSGLIVIAGRQRAGKTTFMEALRRLGYGIRQGDDIPPERDTYRLDAELVDSDDEYRLRLNGYGDPSLTPLGPSTRNGNVPRVKDVFGGLSRQQYRQLYTLSLYQLQRLPPTIDEPEDLSRVLLGAAYGSIADLPEVREEFRSNAHDIGRKNGHPRYGQFSDAYERIQKGKDELEAANEQVEAHDQTHSELEAVQNQLTSIKTDLESLDTERQRLTTVQQHFDDFHRYRQLGESIENMDTRRLEAFPDNGLERAEDLLDDYEAACDEVNEAQESFTAQTTADELVEQRKQLLATGDAIERYENEVSGWQERLKGIQQTATELSNRRTELTTRVEEIRSEWGENLEAVKAIDTDLVDRDEVEQAVESVTDAEQTVDELEEDIEAARERLDTIEAQLESTDVEGSSQAVVIVAGAGLLGILTAIGLATVAGPVAGIVVGAVLLIGGTALAYYRGGTDGESQQTQLKAQQNTVEQELSELTEKRERKTDQLADARSHLEETREELGVEEELSPEGVLTFYRSVVELQGDITAFERELEQHQDRTQELETDLREVATTVADVQSFDWDDEDPLDSADALFDAIEHAATEYRHAAEWQAALDERAAVGTEIQAFFADWTSSDVEPSTLDFDDEDAVTGALRTAIEEGEALEEYTEKKEERAEIKEGFHARFRIDAVREAFTEVYEPPEGASIEEWCLEAFEMVADQYADVAAIEGRLSDIESTKEDLENEREQLQEKQADLKRELEELASEDDLLEARQKIQRGQQTIERLADEYATYRVAEYITEELQDRFIEETTGPLLEDASEIFSQITTEYDGIEHTGELDDLDFHVVQDEATLESSELSRATAEQLFMAVRLARIRQIDTPLPVVLDDALTNFDPAHSARTLGLINELARTNQVFFLTAHPAFIELADEHADVAQFWEVDEGKFEGPFETADAVGDNLELESVSAHIDGSS